MPEYRKHEPTALCYALLALVTLAVYLPVIEARFVTFDDTAYVTSNPTVQAGLTWEGVGWAFGRGHAANWHPLSWLSHMLDCQLYGLNPGGHHLTNLLFHTANTLLLFGLLKRLTGAFWRSAFVAALFAMHPLHVESVAWVAERKDVLSTFFFLLTLGAYGRYAEECRRKNAEGRASARSSFYVLSLVCFALGLMSKPMLVTVPFVLLLLDYWPLNRMVEGGVRSAESEELSTVSGGAGTGSGSPPACKWHLGNRLLEKLPFFALSAASCVVTVIAQRQGGALASLEGATAVTLESRIINTPISYVWYLVKLVWPSDLAVIYPYVRYWPLAEVLGATALVLALTAAALWLGRRQPYFLVGWLWYLGTLVPVIGLVKVGVQSIADRYMYIPSIGLCITLAWGVAELAAGASRLLSVLSPQRIGVLLAVGAAAVLVACATVTARQVLYWLDTETLFRHTLAVTERNYLAFNNLGTFFAQQGQHEMAKKYYRAAIESAPNYLGAWNNLGASLLHQKDFDEAVSALQEAINLAPNSAEPESNLGAALHCMGKPGEAMTHLRRAIELDPEHPLARYNMGNALLETNRLADAEAEFRLATKLNPRYAEAFHNLGLALARQGKLEQGAAQFKRALALQPLLVESHYSLGQVLADLGELDEAVAHFQEALRVHPTYQPAWLQLGIARVKLGRPAEAVEAFSAAVRIKPEDAEAHCQLAAALIAQHKTAGAIQHYRAALKLAPDAPEVLNNLAWILAASPDASLRNGREAVELAERACKLTGYSQPLLVGTLAAAYAEAGAFSEAVAAAEKAQLLAQQSNQPELAARNRALAEQYRSGKPARDIP